jgi:hypothetical protein
MSKLYYSFQRIAKTPDVDSRNWTENTATERGTGVTGKMLQDMIDTIIPLTALMPFRSILYVCASPTQCFAVTRRFTKLLDDNGIEYNQIHGTTIELPNRTTFKFRSIANIDCIRGSTIHHVLVDIDFMWRQSNPVEYAYMISTVKPTLQPPTSEEK